MQQTWPEGKKTLKDILLPDKKVVDLTYVEIEELVKGISLLLPVEIRNLYVVNQLICVKKNQYLRSIEYILDTTAKREQDLLDSSFNWCGSLEGLYFWHEYYLKFLKKEIFLDFNNLLQQQSKEMRRKLTL